MDPFCSGAILTPMTDPAKNGAWASRYLDLWERHLAAENDHPTAQKTAITKEKAPPLDDKSQVGPEAEE